MKLFLLVLMLLSVFASPAESISCCAGRAGCVASCNLQNCATGYCTVDDCSGTCQCSRCDKGSIGGISVG
uniref:Uncharacterized protein n=1 Tax=Steinernema glaseri TaxID=37863 RepID=A0A1I8ACL8_9BILA